MPVINIGADLFADALDAQGIAVTRVAWRPPAGDQHALMKLLADPEVDKANSIAVERMLAAHPVLVDVRPAREVIPAFMNLETARVRASSNTFPERGEQERKLLHAGPPI